MKDKINIYHYGDCGKFDDDNPFKLIAEENILNILHRIGSSQAFSLDENDLNKLLEMDSNDLKIKIKKLIELKMIKEKDNKYVMNFTMILEDDLDSIDKFSKSMAKEISDLIVHKKDIFYELGKQLKCKSHGVDELLYHIIGSHILDGSAIDSLGEAALIVTSKKQNDNRDYILYAFENTSEVDEFSENILCSCNNYRTDNLSFVSFGDAAGDRNDFYRFNRIVSSQINKANSRKETKEDYIKLLEVNNKTIANRCSEIIKDLIDNNNEYMTFNEDDILYVNFLKSFEYLEMKNNAYRVSVPVFYPEDHPVINEIHELLMGIILPVIKQRFLNAKEYLNISAINHGIEIGEILTEMWHQIFGNINEQLVSKKIIKTPDYFKGEGRYLKSIFLN